MHTPSKGETVKTMIETGVEILVEIYGDIERDSSVNRWKYCKVGSCWSMALAVVTRLGCRGRLCGTTPRTLTSINC
jgi:hypothetical protein